MGFPEDNKTEAQTGEENRGMSENNSPSKKSAEGTMKQFAYQVVSKGQAVCYRSGLQEDTTPTHSQKYSDDDT